MSAIEYTEFSIVKDIMQLNFEYDRLLADADLFRASEREKIMFNFENYQKPLCEEIAPKIFMLMRAGDTTSMEPYFKVVKKPFVDDLKKTIDKLRKNETSFDIDLKNQLLTQIQVMECDLEEYQKANETDKNHQKEIVEGFFTKNKALFSTLLNANIELALSLIKETKVLHLQFLFFSNFSSQYKTFFSSLKSADLGRVFKVYFYYSPIDLKEYYASCNLLSTDRYLPSSMTGPIKKVNLRLIKHTLKPSTYQAAKKHVQSFH